MLRLAHHNGFCFWSCVFRNMPMAEEETPEHDELNVTRPQAQTCNCRGRSSSLSEIMQIVTSAVRRFSPSRSRLSVSFDGCHGSVNNEVSVEELEAIAPGGSRLPQRVSRRRGASCQFRRSSLRAQTSTSLRFYRTPSMTVRLT